MLEYNAPIMIFKIGRIGLDQEEIRRRSEGDQKEDWRNHRRLRNIRIPDTSISLYQLVEEAGSAVQSGDC
jgi:hypothetical protein